MGNYYTGRRARHYNARWRTFTRRTLAEALAMIDVVTLQRLPERLGRPPRILDVACGTGVLLQQVIEQVPDAEAYGVDASKDMLGQAHASLKGRPSVHLEQATFRAGEMGGLPYAPETFDLITCTNALHYVAEPGRALAGLRRLLTLEGQLVLEDFARRTSPFPWAAFEWLMKQIDAQYVRAYTFKEAQALCSQAGLDVVCGNVFSVDWLWHGWALRAHNASSGSSRRFATPSTSFPRP